MNQGGGLKRVVRSLPAYRPVRDAVELGVDQFHAIARRLLLAENGCLKRPRYVWVSAFVHACYPSDS